MSFCMSEKYYNTQLVLAPSYAIIIVFRIHFSWDTFYLYYYKPEKYLAILNKFDEVIV